MKSAYSKKECHVHERKQKRLKDMISFKSMRTNMIINSRAPENERVRTLDF